VKRYLVTGAAGFIGFHLCRALLARGASIVGLDSLNNYYDVQLKRDRLRQLTSYPAFAFYQIDLVDREQIANLFKNEPCDFVIHLAAQAGVRYSLENPSAYIESNLVGFGNILEACRQQKTTHLVYASSSSVYGGNTKTPFSIHDNVDHPVSLYAATKKANELMAHTYSHLFNLPTTGLRFFTVYGPWGRPDMALFKFTKAILEEQPIDVFNDGNMKRDFTYIDDIVEGTIRAVEKVATPNVAWLGSAPDPGTSSAPYRIYNLGNHQPVELLFFIETLENCLGKKAKKNLLPLQPGDLPETCADLSDVVADLGFKPHTRIEDGIQKFVDWYREYYR